VLRQRLGDRLDQRTTVAGHLKADGHHTAMAGKFLNRWRLRTPPPGFDHWALPNGGYDDQPWSVDGTVRRVPTYSTTFIDDQVDRLLLRHLEHAGELESTLIYLLSDNGCAWGEHGRVGKFTPYTESIKVPFLVRWPGRLPAGTADDRLAATVDIKPTILQAAGIGLQDGDTVDGRSLLDGRRRKRLLTEYWQDQANAPGIRDWTALRTAGWQYIENYDLTSHPGMERNLLADDDPGNDPPASVAAELAAARTCTGEGCP
jgi:arylsulfatase A-like enzyme